MSIESTATLDLIRRSFNTVTNRNDRSSIGQFLTPVAIAQFMSSMFKVERRNIRILDPGAGTGVLFFECVEMLLSQTPLPLSIEVVAYETDSLVLCHLNDTLKRCESICKSHNVAFMGEIITASFISAALSDTKESFFNSTGKRFTHIILNPPYKKLNSTSTTSRMLYSSGIKVGNLYAVFVWLSMLLLEPEGQMVAITPRSFCNGPYFKKFRSAFLKTMRLRRIHLFDSRREAFGDDQVLRENVIFYAEKSEQYPDLIVISTSVSTNFSNLSIQSVPFNQVVRSNDPDLFIHIGTDHNAVDIVKRMQNFHSSLTKLGIDVSTGPTVDFRVREYLRQDSEDGTAPLIYPTHFRDGFIKWPIDSGKKPNAIIQSQKTSDLFLTTDYYVLTKRFSSKEQKRRIMAAVFDPTKFKHPLVSFENHSNFFHQKGLGLSEKLAKGLAVFLNSTLVDQYFRLFSGHTQVNATDLRKIHYPTHEQLLRLGDYVQDKMPDQATIDAAIEKECTYE
jgi:adenine-specific DNA-methyltransferase